MKGQEKEYQEIQNFFDSVAVASNSIRPGAPYRYESLANGSVFLSAHRESSFPSFVFFQPPSVALIGPIHALATEYSSD